MNKKLPTTIFYCSSIEWFSAFCAAVQEINKIGGVAYVNLNSACYKNNIYTTSDPVDPEDLNDTCVCINQPDESAYNHLDELFAAQWKEHVYKNHGVTITDAQAAGPHSIARLARALVTATTGLYYEPYYLTPVASKNATYYYDIVCHKDLFCYAEIVQKSMPDATIFSYEDPEEAICAFDSVPKVVLTTPSKKENTYLRGLYKGPDNMDKNPLILCIVDKKDENPGRFMFNTASLYYINALDEGEAEKTIPLTIQEYTNRLKYGFSHTEFLKREKPGV